MSKSKIVSLFLAVLMLTVGATSAFAADASAPQTTKPESAKTIAAEKSHNHKDKNSGTRVNVISVAASVLGKTEAEVKDAVKSGKVGDLLTAANKMTEFKTAYLAEAKTKLDAAVTAGTLTQPQADEKYAAEKAKMDAYDGTTHLCGGTDHSKMFKHKKTVTE